MNIDNRTDLGLTDTAGGCSCSATGSAVEAPTAASAVTAEVLVAGMTCAHCVMSVTEELSAIEGVDGVSVDLNAGGASRVTIRSAAPVDAAAIADAVEEAGYSLTGSAS
ncbi:heavy-metal-associated domain-containing protein [Microbacterium sp.]|uniref:heavy-metal-associated domain-containing protein n=1 Tax=Microbacterium sp. TaxID=51671 RepID=UPI003A84A996